MHSVMRKALVKNKKPKHSLAKKQESYLARQVRERKSKHFSNQLTKNYPFTNHLLTTQMTKFWPTLQNEMPRKLLKWAPSRKFVSQNSIYLLIFLFALLLR